MCELRQQTTSKQAAALEAAMHACPSRVSFKRRRAAPKGMKKRQPRDKAVPLSPRLLVPGVSVCVRAWLLDLGKEGRKEPKEDEDALLPLLLSL